MPPLKEHYPHAEIENKWIEIWERLKLFHDAPDSTLENISQDDLYLLFAFVYPSGSGLHVGHIESKTALDILARYFRMKGSNVLFPVGWDAFGLPAENYAIKTGVPPVETTRNAIDTFRGQIKRMGISYSWNNEIATCDPEYYKWTQWMFSTLYDKGLAYQDFGFVNWCPSCQTVLANEQVQGGVCERCKSEVIQRQMKQWFFKISEYKDRLVDGLDDLNWPESTKKRQKEWIGRQNGAQIVFKVKDVDLDITCFTSRPDTVFASTFIAMSPERFVESGLSDKLSAEKLKVVQQFLERVSRKTEGQRKIGGDEKEGLDTGFKAINPVTLEEIPIFIADYILLNDGTGIGMGAPGHNLRDNSFAQKYELPVRQVIENKNAKKQKGLIIEPGVLDGVEGYSGLTSEEATQKLLESYPEAITESVSYNLRDWLISRQRYWGTPIPIVYDPQGNPHLVKQEHLPWLLPTDVDFKPTGESPLKSSKEFIERTERLYGPGWTPEFDTMDTFVDSSWYFLRYIDPHNEEEFASSEQLRRWLPVDLYMIGADHTLLHLLYSRFFTKFLHDEGYVEFDEPFASLRHQGMVLGADGRKMSKSEGNVVNPDDVVSVYGADTLRLYEMFMGPIDVDKPWNDESITGIYKFLARIYSLIVSYPRLATLNRNEVSAVERSLYQTVDKVSSDTQELKFNTAIGTMMGFINVWAKEQRNSSESVLSTDETMTFIKMLAPYAPFVASELYFLVQRENNPDLREEDAIVHTQEWPVYDSSRSKEAQTQIPVQINGKVKFVVSVPTNSVQNNDEVFALLYQSPELSQYIDGHTVKKQIYVPGRMISLVVS